MKTLFAFTAGILVALITATHLTPVQTVRETDVVVRDRIVIPEVMTTLDLDRIRDTLHIDTDLDKQLLAECAYAIQRHTDEPLQGIILYVERYWSGDTCAAHEHQALHGWY